MLTVPLQRGKTAPCPNECPVMTLNRIWWWGSSLEALGNVEYPFITITPRSTLTQSGSTCKGLIYGSNKTSVLGMTLDSIWWWGSGPEALGNVDYPSLSLIPGSLRPGLVLLRIFIISYLKPYSCFLYQKYLINRQLSQLGLENTQITSLQRPPAPMSVLVMTLNNLMVRL